MIKTQIPVYYEFCEVVDKGTLQKFRWLNSSVEQYEHWSEERLSRYSEGNTKHSNGRIGISIAIEHTSVSYREFFCPVDDEETATTTTTEIVYNNQPMTKNKRWRMMKL